MESEFKRQQAEDEDFVLTGKLPGVPQEAPMDKFVSPDKPPEGIERELIECLAEECNEVAQRCMKALRFGIQEVQPGQPLSNAQRIEQELGDLICVFRHLETLGILDWYDVLDCAETKEPKLMKFLQSKFPDTTPPSSGDEKC